MGRGRIIDLTGRRFGHLTVVEIFDRASSRQIIWRCICDCGQTHDVVSQVLRSGKSRSCGCATSIFISDQQTVHGATMGNGTPEYRAWCGMIQRCENKNATQYDDYGGRGITVCRRWRESFEAFLADMGPRPVPTHTIDRIKNHLGYEPGNVRWATRPVQNRNKRNNRWITIGGETHCLADWSSMSGVAPPVIHARLKRGWNARAAVYTPAEVGRNQTWRS